MIIPVAVLGLSALPMPPVNTSGYTLFDPVPREAMRPMSTDRPDTTESPVTVDAGHFQLEMSFVDVGVDNRTRTAERTRTIAVAPMNLKAGLLDSTDLQLVVTPVVLERTESRAGGVTMTDEGFGDFTIRVKHNLWGNQGGATALAIMPYITLPTGTGGVSTGGIEGGVIVPFSIALPADLELGLMAEVDFVRGDGEKPVEFLHSAVLGREILEGVRGFVEYAGTASTRATYIATVNAGLVFVVTGDLAFDVGVRLGLSEAAEDFGVFAGLSLRY